MGSHDHSETSINLLHAVRANDNDAWQRLCDTYSPLVSLWVRKSGLGEWDGADIVQNVFGKVSANLGKFRKDEPGHTFRGWLWTITLNEIRRWFRDQRNGREKALGGSAAHALMLEAPEWIDDDSLSADFYHDDRQLTQQVQTVARVIKQDFAEHTWQAFWRSVVDGQTTGEISEDLQMTKVAVRQAKFRVLARFRDVMSE